MSPRTIQSYTESTQLLARFLTEQGMPTTVVAIQREHLEAFISSLLQRWKPATAHNRYRGCQAFFRWLLEEGEITVSPFAKMKPPQIPEAPAPVLDDAQIKALVAATSGRTFEDKRDAAIIRILLDTGLRLAELANLRYDPREELRSDIDLDFHRLRVVGKGRRERFVGITNRTVAAVDRYLRARSKHPFARLGCLWLGRKGRFTQSGIGQMVRKRGRQAGLGDVVHPHLLRHTFAHRQLSAVPPHSKPTGQVAGSEHVAVLDEARSVREGVVESARGRVRLLREPIDPTRACVLRVIVDRLDQRPSGALPSRFGRGEQILQVAVVPDRPR